MFMMNVKTSLFSQSRTPVPLRHESMNDQHMKMLPQKNITLKCSWYNLPMMYLTFPRATGIAHHVMPISTRHVLLLFLCCLVPSPRLEDMVLSGRHDGPQQ